MSGSWSNTATTSLTLPTGALPPSQRITLDGGTDTILVYNSSGALIASVAASAGSDGLGHSYPAGISSTGGLISQSIILIYNGTPALGTLTASIAGVAATDSFGNNYPAGFTTYDRGNSLFANMQGGLSNWGALVSGQPNINNAGSLQSTSISLIIDAPTTAVLGYFSGLQLNCLTGQTGQLTGASNAPQLGIFDNSDSSAADIRLSGSIIKCDLSTRAPFTWQIPTITGANFNNGGFAGELGTQYRFDALNNLVINVAVTASAIIAAGTTTTLFTLPAAYRPAKGIRMAAYQSTGTAGTYATGIVQAGGAVIVQNPTALAANNVIEFAATIPLGTIP